jgi:hypothetical protein
MRRVPFILIALISLQILSLQGTFAQTNSYKQTNLVSDTAGTAPNVDPKLINPWGTAYFPGQPFCVLFLKLTFEEPGIVQGIQ